MKIRKESDSGRFQAEDYSEKEHKEPSDNTEEDFSLNLPPEYHNEEEWNNKIKKQLKNKDGKIQTIYESGKIEVIFPQNKVK